MKYIKKYNENINWEFDEDESESDFNFKIGDNVILIDNIYEKSISYSKSSNSYRIINDMNSIRVNDYLRPKEITNIDYRYDGEQIFKLKGRYPWFLSKYWKKSE